MIGPPGRNVANLQSRLAEGALSSLDLTRGLLQRIRAVDQRLGAFLRLNPRAEEEADAADRRLAAGNAGQLTGIPVAIKDNLCTANLETTCGSRSLSGFFPSQDATAVRRLREAGAVILGKTNMDEFGMGSSTESSTFGPTRNPWDVSRVPGGSSGGSAVAVSAGLAPLALGSDTGGSVRQPAAFCGVVGLKPTYGRVSRSGLVAFGSSLDQVGPLAGSVSDVATLLRCIAGPDPHDMTSADVEVPNYASACGRGVEGLRIGLPREYLGPGLDPEIETAVRDAATALEAAGARLEEVTLSRTRFAVPTYYLVATAEASSNLARYDGIRFGTRGSVEDGLDTMYRSTRGRGFGAEVKRRIMLGTYALSAGYYEAFYGRAQLVRRLIREDFLTLFGAGIDLVLAPTTPTPAFRLGEKLDDPLEMYLSDVFTVTASLAGLPALAVPIRRNRMGLPMGCQLIAADFDETMLFRAGAELERTFPPESPTLEPDGKTSPP